MDKNEDIQGVDFVDTKPVVRAKPILTEKKLLIESKKDLFLKNCCIEHVDDEMFRPNSIPANLIANIPNGGISLPYRSVTTIDCGFSVELQSQFKYSFAINEKFAEKGLLAINSSYNENRIKVIVANVGKEIITINHGDNFAVMHIEPICSLDWS